MASVESQLLTRARGKVGDIVFFQNHNIPLCIRAYQGSPAYPDTTGQQNVRTAFEWASDQWISISQSLRDDWENYAKTLEHRKPFGRGTPTGRSAFMQVYSLARLLNIRFGLYAACSFPAPDKPGYLMSCRIINGTYTGGGAAGIEYTYYNDTDEDVRVYHRRSSFYSAARNRLGGPFDYSTGGSAKVEDQDDFTREFSYAAGTIGQAVFYRHSFLSDAEPLRLGFPQTSRHIIAAP